VSFRLAACAIAACAIAGCALPLGAQQVSVVLGGSQARYADTLQGTAGWVGARLGVGRGGRAAVVDAAYSRFGSGSWALQLSGQGTALWPVGRSALLGFALGGALNDIQDGTSSGTAATGPMAGFRLGGAQLLTGVTAGPYRTIDGIWNALASGSVRALWSAGTGLSLDTWATGTAADTSRFADLALELQLASRVVRASATVGTRVGDFAEPVWGSADVEWSVAGPIVLEASAGRYPADVTGFTNGLYAQLGVRVFAHREPPRTTRSRDAVEIRRLDASRVRVTVRYAGHPQRLEIAGEWNAWTPVPLAPQGDGTWVADLDLPMGAYAFALVADGTWVLPPGMRAVDDGLGGKVAILIVRR
jgi:hypothetical protein